MPKRLRTSNYKDARPYKRARTSKTRHARVANIEKATFKQGRLSLGNIPQVEYKYVDVIGSFTLNTANPSTLADLLAGVAQGVAVNQRLGDRIILKSIQYKVSTINGTTTSGTPGKVQLSIVLDKQPDNALAAFTDVWSSAHPAYQTFLNVDNDDNRFQTLATDRYQAGFSLQGGATPYIIGDTWGRIWDGFIPLNLATKFKTATGDPVTNTLLFTVGSNAIDTNQTTVLYDFRIRYTDM